MAFRVENLEALALGKGKLERLRDGGVKVLERAASTLKRRLPAQAKRDIGAQYNLHSREIGSRLRCTGDRTSVTLTGLGRNQTLIKFGAKQPKGGSGVVVQIEKGKTLNIAHAFIATPTGSAAGAGPQVFIRTGVIPATAAKLQVLAVIDSSHVTPVHQNRRSQTDRHGYPIAVLGGPTVADMLKDPGREDRLSEFVQKTFAAEVDRLADVAKKKG